MAKLTKHQHPKGKLIRANKSGLLTEADDMDLFSGHKSVEKKCRYAKLPGKSTTMRGKESEYSVLMRSKQAMKIYYGLLESAFKRVYLKASMKAGSTADNMLTFLELRLDNVVYRSGFAATRAEAKQLVSHGHVLVDGKRVTISSMTLKTGQKVSLTESAKKHDRVMSAIKLHESKPTVDWLEVDTDASTSMILKLPSLDLLKNTFKVNLVIELYSK